MNFAVIGGGWAGCAAALTLAEAGAVVTLYEAAPQLGGRARTIQPTESDPDFNTPLDNGQHILLGAYRQTLAVIARVHDAPLASLLHTRPLELVTPPDFSLRCPRLPAPLHVLAGVLGAHGLSVGDKLAVMRGARRLLGRETLPPALSTALADQPAAARARLWEPLCLAALNTPPDEACAASFRNVLQGAFSSRRADSDLLLPRVDLGQLFPNAAARRVHQLGGTVRPGVRVNTIERTQTGFRINGQHDHARVVIAVAPWHVAALTSAFPAVAPLAACLRTWPTQAIATGYLRYPGHIRLSPPMLALANGPGQFAFDRGATHGDNGLIAVVASAANGLLAHGHDDWLGHMADQLAPHIGVRPRAQRGILEKRATWASVPGLQRPPVKTAVPGLCLAGDYTAGPYPATLESAVASGVESAHAVLE